MAGSSPPSTGVPARCWSSYPQRGSVSSSPTASGNRSPRPDGCSGNGSPSENPTGNAGNACSPKPATTPAHRGPEASRVKPADTATFSGFSAAGLAFLAGLERDNTKRYFDTHRRIDQQQLLEPSKTFVVALGAELRRGISDQLRAEPRIGGSLFRIANDLRFAKDKPPYKPHLDLAFWQGDRGPRTDPSLILRITPAEIRLGAGVFALTGAALDHYRIALFDSALATELDKTVSTLIGDGAELSEPTRTRPPAGFQPSDPAARFAVRDGSRSRRDPRDPSGRAGSLRL
jgi:uncharacterized protein (TIGR02453 family)